MTFDEWKDDYGLVYEPNYSEATEKDCRAAWNAHDAEINSLRADANEVQAARFVLKENNDLLVKNHKLREQINMLRDALRNLWNERTPDSYDEACEALAATEQKEIPE